MGLFSKILSKLGLSKPETTATTAAAPAAPVAKPVAAVKPSTPIAAKPSVGAAISNAREEAESIKSAAPVVKPAAISEVDVLKKLEDMTKGSQLNWKVSIVDLLKVLDIDSSLEARKELATELGCPADLMKDSAKMNVWLHKEVLKQIAQNGGNIPKELLD